MPRRKVTRLRKECALLAGHSWTQAERVAVAATDAVRRWLPEDQQVVDLLHLQLCLGEWLEEQRELLTEIDNRHMHELQIDRNLRLDRDAFTATVRERMIQLRNSCDGLFGAGGGAKIFEEAPVVPVDPVALHQLTGHVIDNLDDDDFPMPKPLQRGFKLDRKEVVRDLREPWEQLGTVLKRLAETESGSKFSQARKDTRVGEVQIFVGKVFRFYEALYDLAGFKGLAERVRRSSHSAAAAAIGEDTGTDDDGSDDELEPLLEPPGDTEDASGDDPES